MLQAEASFSSRKAVQSLSYVVWVHARGWARGEVWSTLPFHDPRCGMGASSDRRAGVWVEEITWTYL